MPTTSKKNCHGTKRLGGENQNPETDPVFHHLSHAERDESANENTRVHTRLNQLLTVGVSLMLNTFRSCSLNMCGVMLSPWIRRDRGWSGTMLNIYQVYATRRGVLEAFYDGVSPFFFWRSCYPPMSIRLSGVVRNSTGASIKYDRCYTHLVRVRTHCALQCTKAQVTHSSSLHWRPARTLWWLRYFSPPWCNAPIAERLYSTKGVRIKAIGDTYGASFPGFFFWLTDFLEWGMNHSINQSINQSSNRRFILSHHMLKGAERSTEDRALPPTTNATCFDLYPTPHRLETKKPSDSVMGYIARQGMIRALPGTS